jgi:alkaline phosphatase D
LIAASACAPPQPPTTGAVASAARPQITHGVAAGEVTATSAVVWSRCDRGGYLHVVLDDGAGGAEIRATADVKVENDFTAQVQIDQLTPDTPYQYRVVCSDDSAASAAGSAVSGALRTAPDTHAAKAVQFAWGGDIGGQNVCRDRVEGYPIFHTIVGRTPDFFIGLGDMIYADSPCFAAGRYGNPQIAGPPKPATDLAGFWAYWRYNRTDDALRRLLAATTYYAVWDDHEVMNDFGPHDDTPRRDAEPVGPHLLPIGLKAFLDYNPLPPTPRPLYRTARWGRHLELFFLDTRTYRDANAQRDDPKHPKTMLGRTQLDWLKESLQRSDATWKVIVSSVPLSIPTGANGRDGWANVDEQTGFEYELLDILRFLQAHGIYDHLWIATDIHFAAVFRYTPFHDDPAFHVYEIDTGPLHAGVFPKREFDPTLRPKRLFIHPKSVDASQGFEAAKSWFNFGVMRINQDGGMRIEIINTTGRILFELALRPHGEERRAHHEGAQRTKKSRE